jgi:hypothetical protein
MGLCGEFGYMLWATAADLVMRYGPLRGMKPYSKDLIDFCAMGHSTIFGYGLRGIAQVWLSGMGHSEGFGLAQWTVVQDLVMPYGP